ncbi:MAG TPA: antibiotic biosynthesis monooxygenase [Candidatus Elarobacter sp.]|jgi:heme-degrading monooxygenase HmoA
MDNGPVTHVVVLATRPESHDQVLSHMSEATAQLAESIPALRCVEVYASDDRRNIAIVSEWDSRAAWAHAQWENAMQDATVRAHSEAEWVHGRLYRRVAVHERA